MVKDFDPFEEASATWLQDGKRKADAIDGLIILILLVCSIGLLVWGFMDFTWVALRIVGGVFLLGVLFNYSSRLEK